MPNSYAFGVRDAIRLISDLPDLIRSATVIVIGSIVGHRTHCVPVIGNCLPAIRAIRRGVGRTGTECKASGDDGSHNSLFGDGT